jgi:hypothetical protein
MLALACLLLIGFASTAQAVHVHGEFLPSNAAHVGVPADASQVPGGEINCSLCVAMHAALPVAMAAGVVSTELVVGTEATAVDRVASEPWHFAMFSRPPPAMETL